jgi:hypothetical protein
MSIIRYILAALCIFFLTACGGGGDGAPAIQPTTAILKLSTSGVLAPGTVLGGVGITVVLPAGVTVATDAGGAVSNGVVAVSGVAAPGTFTPPAYTPAAGAVPGKVAFVMASNGAAGFGAGEFATVTCAIAAGHNPKAVDFSLTNFNPVDLNGAPLNGLTVSMTATIN